MRIAVLVLLTTLSLNGVSDNTMLRFFKMLSKGEISEKEFLSFLSRYEETSESLPIYFKNGFEQTSLWADMTVYIDSTSIGEIPNPTKDFPHILLMPSEKEASLGRLFTLLSRKLNFENTISLKPTSVSNIHASQDDSYWRLFQLGENFKNKTVEEASLLLKSQERLFTLREASAVLLIFPSITNHTLLIPCGGSIIEANGEEKHPAFFVKDGKIYLISISPKNKRLSIGIGSTYDRRFEYWENLVE